MERFSPPLTYRDLSMMHREMREVGLFQREAGGFFGNAARHCITHLISSLAANYGNENWSAALNRPVNWQNVIDNENIWLKLGDRIPSKEFLRFFEEVIPRFADTSGQGNFNSWLSFVRSLGVA